MGKTLIALLIDRSGSMRGKQRDVVGGVNSFIEQQKSLAHIDEVSVMMARFDHEYDNFILVTPLAQVREIDADDVQPRGDTALLDAVARTIMAIDEAWHRRELSHAIVVIVTDGEENCSKEYKLEWVKNMIESREVSGKWDFIYLSAGLHAFADARTMGIKSSSTVSYANNSWGIHTAYHLANTAVANLRAGLNPELGIDLAKLEKKLATDKRFEVPPPRFVPLREPKRVRPYDVPVWEPPPVSTDSGRE